MVKNTYPTLASFFYYVWYITMKNTMRKHKELTHDLNLVLSRNYDAARGYQHAADSVENPALKAFFQDQVHERLKFAQELEYEIQMYGGEVDKGESLDATAHRKWMNLKTALASNNDETVVEECIRGEKASHQNYKEVIKNGLPTHGSLHNLLQTHRRQIERSIFHLRSIESIVS